MARTSKKMEWLNHEVTLIAHLPSNVNRYAKAYKLEGLNDDEWETQWVFDAGYDGMPADYTERWDTIEELARSMREFANLRHWVQAAE